MTTVPAPRHPAHPEGDADPAHPSVAVRVEETGLPPHEPLRLYTALRERFCGDGVHVPASLEGPLKDRGGAVAGHDRIAGLQVNDPRVTCHGPEPLAGALPAQAGRLAMESCPPSPASSGTTAGALRRPRTRP